MGNALGGGQISVCARSGMFNTSRAAMLLLIKDVMPLVGSAGQTAAQKKLVNNLDLMMHRARNRTHLNATQCGHHRQTAARVTDQCPPRSSGSPVGETSPSKMKG